MQRVADLWGGSPLASFNHVIDPHVVIFSISLCTASMTMAADLRCFSIDPHSVDSLRMLHSSLAIRSAPHSGDLP